MPLGLLIDGSAKLICISSADWERNRKTLISGSFCHPTDQNSTESTPPEVSVPTQGLTPRMVETFEPVNSFPSQVEGAAVQPVKGVRQLARSEPKKKKDLGTLGRS